MDLKRILLRLERDFAQIQNTSQSQRNKVVFIFGVSLFGLEI